jgi:pyruvate/2-oxoglutarate dehydrogenase complex dihydrolipoamide acyltransferase (E2) component
MHEVLVPRLGVAVTAVTVLGWLVEDGATVEPGQPILEVATDKTEVEIEATQSGVLRQRASPEEEYPVGAVIGVIE